MCSSRREETVSLKKRRHGANELPRKRGNTAHSPEIFRGWRENLSASTVAKRLECAASRRFSVRWRTLSFQVYRRGVSRRLLPSAPNRSFLLQSFDQDGIGSGKFKILQFRRRYPAEIGATQGPRFIRLPITAEKLEANGSFRVGMCVGFEQLPDLHFDSEFLLEFARKALFECFSGLEFAAGKFPQSSEMRVVIP